MPVIVATALRSVFGDVDQTWIALSEGKGSGRIRPLGPLFDDLLDLARTLTAQHPCDRCVVASTKGDCPRWLEGLEHGEAGPGGLADLADALGQALGIPCVTVSAACASGTTALGIAGRWCRSGQAQRVLVLGGETLSPFISAGFSALRALDPQGSRPFSADRAGLGLGELRAGLVLAATGDGPGLIGWGARLDARHLTAPDREAQGLEQICRAALGDRSAALIIAHGTGTSFNDDAEAICYHRLAPGVPVTASKGVLGHTLGACGLVDTILASEALRRGRIFGVAATTEVQAAAPIHLLPGGEHALIDGAILVANAGFGGINAAVAVAAVDRTKTLPMPVVEVTTTLRLNACTWHRLDAGGERSGAFAEELCHIQGLGRARARLVLGRSDATWGRMDQASRLASTLALLSGPHHPDTACILWTRTGCAESDRIFESDRRLGRSDPQRFPYTLASTPIGEASIRAGLHGPGFAIAGGDLAGVRAIADALLAEGCPAVLLMQVEADVGPQVAWAEIRQPRRG